MVASFLIPLAMRILGEEPDVVVADALEHPNRRWISVFVAARTRFSEDALAQAVADGVVQLVILGAGLDTFAYRSPFKDCLHVFEVDRLATQVRKRQLLTKDKIQVPTWLTFVPVDFEGESLTDQLALAGFDSKQRSFFSWLGVVPYLTESEIWSILGYIAGLPNGAHVVFDYANPPASYTLIQHLAYNRRASKVDKLG